MPQGQPCRQVVGERRIVIEDWIAIAMVKVRGPSGIGVPCYQAVAKLGGPEHVEFRIRAPWQTWVLQKRPGCQEADAENQQKGHGAKEPRTIPVHMGFTMPVAQLPEWGANRKPCPRTVTI